MKLSSLTIMERTDAMSCFVILEGVDMSYMIKNIKLHIVTDIKVKFKR